MDEARKVDPDPQGYEQFEDEIELMDYLKVLWKWKYLIIVGTLVCAIGAAVVSLNMTRVYAITTAFQPGILKVNPDGKIVYIDSAPNIKALIETNAINGALLKNIKTPNQDYLPTSVGFKVTIPKGTNAIEVLYETSHVDIGVQIVKNLSSLLFEKYKKRITAFHQDYDSGIRDLSNEMGKINENISKVKNSINLAEVERKAELEEIGARRLNLKSQIAENQFSREDSLKQLDNDISTIKAEMKAKKKQHDNLEEGIPNIKLEIDRINKNTDLLIQQRNRLLSSTKKNGDVLSTLIYSNTIQQNISYLNTLRGTIHDMTNQIYRQMADLERLGNRNKDLTAQKESVRKQTDFKIDYLQRDIKDLGDQEKNMENQTEIEIANLKSQINDLRSDLKYKSGEIKDIEYTRDNIQNIQIIKQPKASPSPIKPKTRLNVMLAGVVGLFLTVFLAFFVEYISKYNSREDGP